MKARGLRQVLSVAVLPVVFMLPITLLLMWRVSAIHVSEQREERSDVIISATHVVREQLAAMEADLRSYLRTGEVSSRSTFGTGRAQLTIGLEQIKSAAKSDRSLTEPVGRLTVHIGTWLAVADRAITAVSAEATPADQRHADSVTTSAMKAIQRDLSAVLDLESDQREANIAHAERLLRLIILLAIASALIAAVATGYVVRRMLQLTLIEQEAERERVRLEEARRWAAELERENERVRTADRLKSDYVANMSHELRTPLTAIIGFAEVLRDGKAGPLSGEQAEFLDDILKSGRHLLEIIGTVLDLAKVEAGNLDVSMSVIDPSSPARDVVDGLYELAERKAIRISLETNRAPRRVLIDPARLRQILYNYLSNAIKFTRAGGRVTVRVLAEGRDGFRAEVEDNGIGIAPEDLGSLFKEFRQVDAAATRQGTGIGLALTKRFAEAQGGSVGVTSARGRGSTFYVIFPRAVASVTETALEPELIHAS